MREAVTIVRTRFSAAPVKHGLGALIALLGLASGLGPALQAFTALAVEAGAATPLLASTLAGGATGLGALVLWRRHPLSDETVGAFVAAAAGMMLAAALFSLLLPAIALADRDALADPLLAATGGIVAMAVLDRIVGQRPAQRDDGGVLSGPAVTLMVAGIALHNLPEGFAVGAGFGGGEAFGWSTAVSIGAQNVPEGLVVATALWIGGMKRTHAALLALGSGLLEPLGALAGTAMVGAAPVLMPMALAVAGGAMLYVVFDELLPAVFARSRTADLPGRSTALIGGFAAMAALAA